MEKRLRNYYKTLIATDRDLFVKDLADFVKKCDVEKTHMLLDLLQGSKCEHMLMSYRENEGETILHIAAKYQDDDIIVKKLIDLCPNLMTQARNESDNYSGQTALHIAVTKGNTQAVEAMLVKAETVSSEFLNRVLYTQAQGFRFTNTVMMGEVPLSIAALKFDEEMVNILLKYGAELNFQNSRRDTVFHSLIKYAAIYPDKTSAVLGMIDELQNALQEKGMTDRFVSDSDSLQYLYQYSYVWLLKNEDSFTPLQLAAKLGIVEIFQYIINLKDIYCFLSTHDGLFDIKMYDITEVDSIANNRVSAIFRQKGSILQHNHRIVPGKFEGVSRKPLQASNVGCFTCKTCSFEYPVTESVLEMLYDNDYDSKSAFRIIEIAPIKNLVREKWKFYRIIYFIWMAIHSCFISALTVYAVERTTILYPPNATMASEVSTLYPIKNSFFEAFKWISFVFGLLYLFVSMLTIVPRFRRPHAYQYFLHNIGYVILLTTFSLCIIVDTFMTHVNKSHDSIPLILALLMGWWFNIFFLRAFKLFGFFTELIKRVIFGDFLRFWMVIIFELIAFTAAMHILFQTDDESMASTRKDHETYGSTMLVMFKLMIGLGDIESLYDTRVPWLAVLLFVIFVIFTFILLFNALIAMMSQTCALVLEDRYPQWRIQQLSVILFIEDIFCQCCINRVLPCPGEMKKVRGFDIITKQSKSDNRLFLEIHSLQMEYATEEDRQETANKVVPSIPSGIGVGTQHLDMSLTNSLYNRGVSNTGSFYGNFRPSSIRKRFDVSPVDDIAFDPVVESKKKVNKRLKKELSVVQEEDLPETKSKEHSKGKRLKVIDSKSPDVIVSDRSPVPSRASSSKRRRHNSENLDYRDTEDKNSPSPEVYASAPSNIGAGERVVDIKVQDCRA